MCRRQDGIGKNLHGRQGGRLQDLSPRLPSLQSFQCERKASPSVTRRQEDSGPQPCMSVIVTD